MLNRTYFILFFASVALINPWGSILFFTETGRAEVWTFPKVLIVALIVVINFSQIIRYRSDHCLCLLNPSVDRIWISLCLFFMASATFSMLLSPFPLHALFGHPVLGDGLLYWILILGFFASNTLVVRLQPNLFKPQLVGLLLGGCIVGLSIIPQIWDWRIDYTLTSGQISHFDDQLLQSSIWQAQMPIGLYSNRGHTSFILASSICLGLAAIINQWLVGNFWKYACVFMILPLLATQTLASIMACLMSVGYLIVQSFRQEIGELLQANRQKLQLIMTAFISVALLICFKLFLANHTFIRNVNSPNYEILEDAMTGRLYLWFLSWKGIVQKPLLGWGFNGFGIAHLFVGDWLGKLSAYIPIDTQVIKILDIHEYTFDFLSQNGEVHSGTIFSHKAHNLLLDLILSVGILGTFLYLLLFGYSLWALSHSSFWALSSVVITYLIFTQAWFESAQFSHLPWWCLSIGVAAKQIK